MAHKSLINYYGKMMIDMAKDLYPIDRSITGEGVRKTLNIIKKKFFTYLNVKCVKTFVDALFDML